MWLSVLRTTLKHMEILRYDSRTVLTFADDRMRSVRAKAWRRPRPVFAPQPRPLPELGVTATPRIPAPRPSEPVALPDKVA